MRKSLSAVRDLDWRVVPIVCLSVAALAVVVSLPRRWNGALVQRGEEIVRYVPLRPITPIEAAALVKCDRYHTHITQLTADYAYFNNGVFVRPETSLLPPSGDIRCPDVQRAILAVGKEAWDWNVGHRVDRPELERALGRTLTLADMTAARGITTYVSYLWWLFAVGDAVFIATLYTALTRVLVRIRRPSTLLALPAILLVFRVAWLIAVFVYSPASGSGAYHQRILVEDGPWPTIPFPLPWFVDPFALASHAAIAGLVVLALMRAREHLPIARRTNALRYWGALVAISLVTLAILTASAYRHFTADRQSGRSVLSTVQHDFPLVQATILSDPEVSASNPFDSQRAQSAQGPIVESNLLKSGRLQPDTAMAIQRLLSARSGHLRLTVYIPTHDQTFAVSIAGSRTQYTDIRYLRHDGAEDAHAQIVELMLDQQSDFSQSFIGYLFRPHREGRLLRGANNEIAGVAVSEAQSDAAPRLRTYAVAVCGIDCRDHHWN